MRAGLELGRHHRVHIDHDLFLLGVLGVPHFYLLGNPILERLADDRRADVHDPLFRDLRDVGLVRQIRAHLRLRIYVFKNLL